MQVLLAASGRLGEDRTPLFAWLAALTDLRPPPVPWQCMGLGFWVQGLGLRVYFGFKVLRFRAPLTWLPLGRHNARDSGEATTAQVLGLMTLSILGTRCWVFGFRGSQFGLRFRALQGIVL